MKYEKILVPYDGSSHAQGAFTAARDLAAKMGDDAMIYVVNVIPMAATLTLHATESVTSHYSFTRRKEYAEDLEKALSKVKDEMKEELTGLYGDFPADRIVIDAIANPTPVQGLVGYAEEHECGLIVMGRRGLGAVRGMLGSVSYGVLRATDIPVLTVK